LNDALRRSLQAALPDLDAILHTLDGDLGATIRPAGGPADTAPRHPALQALSGAEAGTHLTFEGLLGEGGMGRVRQATQVSLGRKVAVKSLRPDARRPDAIFSLLHEAWITGRLEHPNVVPIHDMCLDEAGEPLIVLKRIEGRPWSELLARPELLRERFGVEEPLLWHLQILMQICTTVAFAHSRGVIHRDLKPDNVMIGAYGEVYLLDWGIAVSLLPDPSGRLPLASEVKEMAGTPIYMAPEMLCQPGAVLGERTDVYLLGAILFELLTGRAPHQGGGVMEVLMRVVRSEPDFPVDAPPELVSLCRRAMAPAPADRLASAEAMRGALQDWLAHRPSLLLTSQAERALAEMMPLLALPAGAEADPEAQDGARRLRYKLLGECRFGFRQAMAIWPENRRAADGLRWAIRASLEHELAQRDHRAAAALLPELTPPSPEMERAIEALRRENEAEARRLDAARSVAESHDLTIGVRTRRFFALVLGVLWTALPLLFGHIGPEGLGWWKVAGPPTLFLLIVAALSFWARETMMRTAVNRRVIAAMVLACGTLLWLDLAHYLAGLDPAEAIRVHPMVVMAVIWMGVATIDARFWPTGLAVTAAALVGMLAPAWVLYAFGLVNLAMGINGLWVWRVAPKPQGPQTSG
jgi:serine/threonine-protein kinase